MSGDLADRDQDTLEVGDILDVVITEPNPDGDKDPMTQVDGVATFVRYPGDYQPEFGETARCRVADVGDTHIVLTAVQRDVIDRGDSDD